MNKNSVWNQFSVERIENIVKTIDSAEAVYKNRLSSWTIDQEIKAPDMEYTYLELTDNGEIVWVVLGIDYPEYSDDHVAYSVRMGQGILNPVELEDGPWDEYAHSDMRDLWDRELAPYGLTVWHGDEFTTDTLGDIFFGRYGTK